MIRRFLPLVMLLLSFSRAWEGAPARARDIYVDNVAGDDTRIGMRDRHSAEFSGPVRTIGKALRLATVEDRIILAKTGVPYRESISLVGGPHSGSPEQPFVLDGNDAILDGSAPLPAKVWETYRGSIYRYRPKRLAYQQLFLAVRPLKFRPPLNSEGTLPPLEPLEWTLAGGHVYFRTEAEKLIDEYDLSAPVERVGLTLYNVHDVMITNLTVQGFQLDGVNAFDNVRDCTLISVTSRGNGRSGITVANCSHLRIIDALIGDNLYAQLYTEGLSVARVEVSDLLPQTAPAIIHRGREVLIDGKWFSRR